MTPEAQRIAIAEACGWIPEPSGRDSFGVPYNEFWRREHETITKFPDYPEDLNAMHEAEIVLLRLGNKGHEYILHLWEITGLQGLRGPILLSKQSEPQEFHLQIDKIWELWVKATSAQCAEAFLKTLGLWKP